VQRDPVLDVLRGLCIVSMVVAHLAYGSPLSRGVNVSALVDGASGFFLLSGLVLGMVHQRCAERLPEREGQIRLLRRAGRLYAIHVLLLLAVLLTTHLTGRGPEWSAPGALGGWGEVLLDTFTLRLNPQYFGILSVYVPLLLLSAVVVPLLRRGRTVLVGGLVLGIYLASFTWPAVFTLPETPGVEGFWSWGGWQALFFSGMFLGWHWHGHDLRERLLRTRTVLLSVGALTGLMLLWRLLPAVGMPLPAGVDGEQFRWWLYGKGAMGPMRLIMALLALLVLYAVINAVYERGWSRPPLSVVARIGRKSLDSFIISRLVIVALPLVVVSYDPTSWAAVGLALATLAAGWGWAVWREEMSTFDGGLHRVSLKVRGDGKGWTYAPRTL